MRLLLFLLLGFGLPASAKIFEIQIEQESPQSGNCGQFRLWLPAGSHPKRILLVIWGSNQCSLSTVDDPVWQKLAESIDCGLMAGLFFPQTFNNHWDHADEGSGEALIEAVNGLALANGESQLSQASFYLVGDSQGGQFAFSFASWRPTRTAGFISLKGGRHDFSAVPGAAGVPGLFVAGEMDASFRLANITDVFSNGRTLGAPWCLAVDPHGGHSPDSCGPLVLSYLQALSGMQPGEGSKNEATSATPDLIRSTYGTSARSWFPNAAFEREWSAFESGMLQPSSQPLTFKSVMPPSLGTVNPPSEDLGTVESGRKSQQFPLAVTPAGEAVWDEVRVLHCPYLSDEKVVKLSPNRFEIRASLGTSDLPLGRFTGVLPLRFKSHGSSILGGVNVPLTATITGDVAAIPPLILLKVGPNGSESTHLQITSKKKQPITLLTYQAAPGVTVKSSSGSPGLLELIVSFDALKASPSELVSGSLLLHLRTDKEWLLRVPYVNSSP